METPKQTEFLTELSKAIQKTFNYVSEDVNKLTSRTEKLDKSTNLEINKVKKDLSELRTTVNKLRGLIVEVEKKVKRSSQVITEQSKPVKNKELEKINDTIDDIKLSIKAIEQKLKMD